MLALSSQQAINGQAGTVALGGISRYSYLAANVAPYTAEEWVNAHTPPDAVIALVHTTLGYYLDRDQLDDWYSTRRLSLEAGRRGAGRRVRHLVPGGCPLRRGQSRRRSRRCLQSPHAAQIGVAGRAGSACAKLLVQRKQRVTCTP